MACPKCSPPEQSFPPPATQQTTGAPAQLARLGVHLTQMLMETNRGGFPKFSQLSLVSAPPSPTKRRSPRKRAVELVSHSIVGPQTFPYTTRSPTAFYTHPASPILGTRQKDSKCTGRQRGPTRGER